MSLRPAHEALKAELKARNVLKDDNDLLLKFLSEAEREVWRQATDYNNFGSLIQAWDFLHEFHRQDPKHRKGFRCSELNLFERLDYAHKELDELIESPNDITEMADVLAILLHYAIVQGWSQKDLCINIIKKVKLRFPELKHEVPSNS